MTVKKKSWQHVGEEETKLGKKGAVIQGCKSRQPQERKYATKRHAVARKRRRSECVGSGVNPSDGQNREDSGTGQRTAVYGKHCVPLGKRGNL